MNRSTKFGREFFSTIRLAYSLLTSYTNWVIGKYRGYVYIRLKRKGL